MYSCGRPARRVTAPRAGECGLGESRKAGVTRPQPSQPPPFRANGEKRHAKEEAGSGQRGERASDGTVADLGPRTGAGKEEQPARINQKLLPSAGIARNVTQRRRRVAGSAGAGLGRHGSAGIGPRASGGSRKAGVTRPQPSQPPPFRANREKRHGKEEMGSLRRAAPGQRRAARPRVMRSVMRSG